MAKIAMAALLIALLLVVFLRMWRLFEEDLGLDLTDMSWVTIKAWLAEPLHVAIVVVLFFAIPASFASDHSSSVVGDSGGDGGGGGD